MNEQEEKTFTHEKKKECMDMLRSTEAKLMGIIKACNNTFPHM